MYIVDMYLRVPQGVPGGGDEHQGGVPGVRAATETLVRKMLSHPVPPGYRRKRPPLSIDPKLEPYTGVIDGILEDDLSAPKKAARVTQQSASSSG